MSVNRKKAARLLLRLSAAMLAVSLGAKFVTGYVLRGWRRLRDRRGFSVDVVAPQYAPALVVSTEDFDGDPLGQIFEDGYHTQTFRKLAWLETLRRISVAASLGGVLVALLLALFSREG